MFIKLSYCIDSKTPVYGGGEGFFSEPLKSIKKGDTCNTSKWTIPSHLGTHIDFPHHFFNKCQTVEDFALDFWFFKKNKIQFLEAKLSDNEHIIKPDDIKISRYSSNAELIILKTGFGKFRKLDKYWKFNPGVSIELTDWIKKKFKKIKIFGIDSISISSYQSRKIGRIVHKKLLDFKNPILIVEDMNLSQVSEHTIFNKIWIFPLMVKGMDASPCTIFADVKIC